MPLVLVACASDPETGLGSVVIDPTPMVRAGSGDAVNAYYDTVFAQMRGAWRSGGLDGLKELRFLIKQHKRDEMVGTAAQRMSQFELLADGLEFDLQLPELCRIVHLNPSTSLDTAQKFELRLSQKGERVLECGGPGKQELVLRAVVTLRDFDVSGQFVEMEDSLPLRVSERKRLTGGAEMVLPFELPGARSEAVVRELVVRVELLPCLVTLDGRDVPVSQPGRNRMATEEVEKLSPKQRIAYSRSGFTHCAVLDVMSYPAGYEAIQKAPLATMREAQRRGDAKYFKHTFLAAHFMPPKDRDNAMGLLINHVRTGTASQARVAMGALRLLSGQDMGINERRAWLVWWKRYQGLMKKR
jgi:hypothetical protein